VDVDVLVVVGVGTVVAIEDVGAGAGVVPFVSVPVSLPLSPFTAVVGADVGSVFVAVLVVVAGVSVNEICVPASFDCDSHSDFVYSAAGFEVDRRLTSVGVWTSAIIAVARESGFFLKPKKGDAQRRWSSDVAHTWASVRQGYKGQGSPAMSKEW
jgi:hypothetical protein